MLSARGEENLKRKQDMTTSPTHGRSVLRTILPLWACAMVISVAAGCGDPPQTEKASVTTQSVETVVVEKRDLFQTVTMPGTVEGYETVDLYAKVGGYLEKFAPDANDETVDIGSPIEKNQDLAYLWIPEMGKELKQKEALVEQAEAQIEQAVQAIRQAEADVESAKAALVAMGAEREEKVEQGKFRQKELDRVKAMGRSVRGELVDAAEFQLAAARAALRTVEAKVTSAEKQVDGADASLEKTKADHTAAKARRDVTEADRDYVETMIEYAVIKAPFNGSVTRRWLHPGAFVQPAEGNSAAKPLLSVTRTDKKVRIFLDIPMDNVRYLDKGDRAVLDRISVLPDAEPFEGKVKRFSAALNMKSRMLRVEVELDNDDDRLRPGYYGSVTLYLHKWPDTLVIPSTALLTDGEKSYVFVARGGKATKQPVTPIYQDGIDVFIKPGDLKAGDQVVKAGGGQLSDGQDIIGVPVK